MPSDPRHNLPGLQGEILTATVSIPAGVLGGTLALNASTLAALLPGSVIGQGTGTITFQVARSDFVSPEE